LRIAIIDTMIGAFAVRDDGEVIAEEYTTKEMNTLIERALKIDKGEPSDEFKKVVERVVSEFLKEGDEVVVEYNEQARYLSSKGVKFSVEPGYELIIDFRKSLPKYAVKAGFIESEDEYPQFIHKISLGITRMKLRQVAQKRDQLAIQSIRAIDDIDKTINLFASRLREWYSVHFPELDDLVRDHIEYARIVAEIGDRSDISVDTLRKLGFSEVKAKRIAEAAKTSIGAELSDFDIRPIQTLANIMLEMNRLRETLTDYVGHVMREVAPNITELVGPLLGARLLSLAGSLENVAKLPASTVQVLGAEKALFRALRTGGRPPKHGIIFQYPEIHKAPRWQRGKIARALATKLAIAAKADFFTGRFIADKLKKSLLERIEEIKTLYGKPPPKKPVEKRRERPRKRRKGPWRGKRGK